MMKIAALFSKLKPPNCAARKHLVVAVLICCAARHLSAQHENHAPSRAGENNRFNSIKALAGDWEGSFEWVGTTRKGPMNARYYLTGNGSAVVEDLIAEGTPNMTTVYHLDGADLRATHYCAAGNQPRLKSAPEDGDADSVRFRMIDITNLSSPEAGHVKNLQLRWDGSERLTILFTFVGGTKENVEKIELTRKHS